MALEIRTTFCEIFLNGWTTTQIIWRTRKCLCPHTLLRTQIRNVLREWHQTQGGIVFLLTSKKDRNCEVRLRTKITRAPCRRRSGEAVPQAEKLGELITADHKVLNVEGESRNNHRYAVVVQDLANQWISQETEKSLRKFLEPSQRPKVMCTENSLVFGKSCEEVSWNHRTRSETNGFAERAVRRVTERTSAVLLQSGLDEQMVG